MFNLSYHSGASRVSIRRAGRYAVEILADPQTESADGTHNHKLIMRIKSLSM